MNTVFVNFVVVLIICEISSSVGENCTRYYSKHDVSMEIDGCDRETFLENEIHSVQCAQYCERDPQVGITVFVKGVWEFRNPEPQ